MGEKTLGSSRRAMDRNQERRIKGKEGYKPGDEQVGNNIERRVNVVKMERIQK